MKSNLAVLSSDNKTIKFIKKNDLEDLCNLYANSSRNIDDAKIFSDNHGFEKYYGSYEDLIEDGNIDRIKKAVQKLKDIPILPQMSKFKTMIDDIALKLSKSVDFVLDGDGVAMNKESYNLLQDAMVHILRNALDHGLELPKERQEMGKNPKGTIKGLGFKDVTTAKQSVAKISYL